MHIAPFAAPPAAAVPWSDAVSSIAQAVQAAAIIGGGIWALYLFRTSRKAEARVAIEHHVRLVSGRRPVLLIALRITNSSAVLFSYESATCTLFDASTEAPDGEVRLIPFGQLNPLVPVYWELTDDPEAIKAGKLFADEPEGISLEPGESVDTEVAFPLRVGALKLMAARVVIQGCQGWRRSKPWDWSSFWYIAPADLGQSPSKPSRRAK